ncbi:MAG: SMC-Scp complex subunit ScpB [Thermoplasmata archaeon]|nr:SMC-Scp complex subunit ScpB [Thermoplasmata archaeon]
MEAKGAVEAALFSSSENLRISDIAERTGFPEEEVRTALMDLRREYDDRDSAIVIAKIGSEFRMMLRSEYSDYTGKFGKAEMSGGLMRTLSTIAYNQPVLQSDLVKTRGPRAYEDVHALEEMDFVSAKRVGQTKELTTTKRFSEYFGIGSTRKADIRKWIEAQASNQRPPEGGSE